MAAFGLGDELDVVVIGTGAGGAPLLATLAQAGCRVVALEAGGVTTPGLYPADEIVSSELYWLDERLAAGAGPQAFGANNSGTGVGGSMLHWGAYVPRADARDLRIRSEFGVGADWPLDLAELEPFYREVEAFIGVSGPAQYPWDEGRRYPLPPVALNAPAEAMRRGCAAIGVRTAEAPIAAVSRPFPQMGAGVRPACVGCGYCHQGCRFGAKASMDVTYLPAAVAAGAEIRPGCFVHGLELGPTGAVTAVVYRRDGQDRRQRCRAVALCAGAVETPRLLLHTGVGNGSGQVGRNYMSHVATQVWGTFEREMRPHKGFPASLITEDMIRPGDADFVGGYLVQSLGIVPATWAQQVARGRGTWGQEMVDYLHRYNHVAGIGINGDCLPQPGNRLELSDEVDHTGVAKPVIHFEYGPSELAMSRHAERMMHAAWGGGGGFGPLDVPALGPHHRDLPDRDGPGRMRGGRGGAEP